MTLPQTLTFVVKQANQTQTPGNYRPNVNYIESFFILTPRVLINPCHKYFYLIATNAGFSFYYVETEVTDIEVAVRASSNKVKLARNKMGTIYN